MMETVGNYNISYSNKANRNKTFVFVKLTDSCLTAIMDHLTSTKAAPSPTIQFQSNSNQGVLNFSSNTDGNSENERRFSFNVSNVDADGPQGSFELVRQSKSRVLESLGNMQYKMQIHASDDIYQKTKVRMATMEKESKKNCTKVIKDNDASVGRKVKVKNHVYGASKLSNTINLNNHHSNSNSKLYSPPTIGKNNLQHVKNSSGVNHCSNSSNSSSCVNSVENHHHRKNVQPSNVSNVNASNVTNSSLNNGHFDVNNQSNVNTKHQQQQSNSVSNQKESNQSANNPEIMKYSLRDRLIHLLALRPYKKPELMMRIQRDGVREKDKKAATPVLTSIAKFKENAYHLSDWSEVQVEDWPFYSPEQRDIVRKRIAQNSSIALHRDSPFSSPCTCGPSSPGSSSTCSKHGNLHSLSNNINNAKKHLAPQMNQVIKKQRGLYGNNGGSNNSGMINNTINNLNRDQKRDQRSPNLNSNSMNDNSNSNNLLSNNYNDLLNGWPNKSSPDGVVTNGGLSNHGGTINNGDNYFSKTSLSNNWNGNNNNNSNINNNDYRYQRNHVSPDILPNIASNNGHSFDEYGNEKSSYSANHNAAAYNGDINSNRSSNNIINNSSSNLSANMNNRPRQNEKNGELSSALVLSHTGGHDSACSTPNSSPDSGTGSNDGSLSTTSSKSTSSINNELKHIEISNDEQRSRYRADFNREYIEYRRLHGIVDEVAKKFSNYEAKLKSKVEGSDEWNLILEQILGEYDRIRKDGKYMHAKRKVNELHEKLSHIKRLLNEYDRKNKMKNVRIERSY